MNHSISKFLFDIIDSIEVIEKYLESVTELSSYRKDIKTIDAVERRLAIIGEALWKASKIESQIAVSNIKKIISLRHILVHDYDLIEDETIWIICQKHLPVLKSEIKKIIDLG